MDIRHIQKYECIPVNVTRTISSAEIIKPRVHELPEKTMKQE